MNFAEPFRNKDISWLAFNERVLQEAESPDVPLLDRFKFISIFSSNLDEYFRVRVAALQDFKKAGKKAEKLIKYSPAEIIREIQHKVKKLNTRFHNVLNALIRELNTHNIFLRSENEISDSAKKYLHSHIKTKLVSRLVPVFVKTTGSKINIRDAEIYLFVRMTKKTVSREQYALIEIPAREFSRLYELPSEGQNRIIMFLDDIIRIFLPEVFRQFEFTDFDAWTVKITRNAQFGTDTDLSESIIRKIDKNLKKRKKGTPVRFVHDEKMPLRYVQLLSRKIGIGKDDTIMPGGRYHNIRDFMNFLSNPPVNLSYPVFEPVIPQGLGTVDSLLDYVQKKDILLHFPYHSFNYVIRILKEAAIDPSVRAIKITIYRAAKHSAVMGALIGAARNGKKVTVVLELQARFDEEANIKWSAILAEEGVMVIPGVPGLKIHSKTALILRSKGKNVALFGTGNYNEDTAKIYTDHLLITANQHLTAEAQRLFEFFKTPYNNPVLKKCISSPWSTRHFISDMISNEVKQAKKGNRAEIILKMNGLTDHDIICDLYKAASLGVKISLIVRGMFSAYTENPECKGNIHAVSIVDKFLEHSRLFYFYHKGEELIYLSSADMMGRNLDNRIEITCPVFDKEHRADLKKYLDICLSDNTKARILDNELSNVFHNQNISPKVRAQEAIPRFLELKNTQSANKNCSG